jgi:hypothetical protein
MASQYQEREERMSQYPQREPSAWAVGWTWFAGFMMILIGCWHAIAGLSAIIDDKFFVVVPKYILKFDATTWGWIHLILGIVIVLAGFAVFTGAVWARTVGVILAVISAIAAFSWIPYYPVWGVLISVAAISVIWALTAHGRDVTASDM